MSVSSIFIIYKATHMAGYQNHNPTGYPEGRIKILYPAEYPVRLSTQPVGYPAKLPSGPSLLETIHISFLPLFIRRDLWPISPRRLYEGKLKNNK